MLFKIFDVGHGFCALAIAGNGNVVVFDCGHKADPVRRPSTFLPQHQVAAIEYLVVTNYDEDHISDLPELKRRLPIAWLYRNASLTADQLRAIKLESGPISPAMEALLGMIGSYTDTTNTPPETPGVTLAYFYNVHPSFTDTNNLSLVTFLTIGALVVCIPGDLETAGWQAVLRQPGFRDHLERVNVFVASHHGRESGYCDDVFDYCRPEVIIFSDSNIKHASQEMTDTYARHASGIQFNGQTRYVLTTRNDGDIQWNP